MNAIRIQLNSRGAVALVLALLILVLAAAPALAWEDEGEGKFSAPHSMVMSGAVRDNSSAGPGLRFAAPAFVTRPLWPPFALVE
jgi:hypothetical protein